MKPQNIEDVLVRLHSGQWFGWKDSTNKIYENLIIYSKDAKPTKEWLEAEITRLQAEYDAQAYARARAEAYPSWQEQMDMMFHDQTEGSRTWLDAIEAVKEAYPK